MVTPGISLYVFIEASGKISFGADFTPHPVEIAIIKDANIKHNIRLTITLQHMRARLGNNSTIRYLFNIESNIYDLPIDIIYLSAEMTLNLRSSRREAVISSKPHITSALAEISAVHIKYKYID